ncbi:MAG: A/G-specific adenine glycosylase [Planctomycetota bacterium]
MPERDALVADLLAWFAGNARDLPWRRDPSPWRVFVAEAMCQQTRIAAVLPRYAEFLARFPDPAAMAEAGEDAVLALWSGLGYYRRARNLHAAARTMVADHGGRVPGTPGEIRALPGVGDYTAGAVLSTAFGLPEPLVDGNVERVLSRIFAVEGNVKRGAARKAIRDLAADLVTRGDPAAWNQALMELGALVCLPRGARCGDCPVAVHCGAREAGRVDELPELPAKREPVDVELAIAIIDGPEGVLFLRAPEGGFLAGTWMPPFARVEAGETPAEALRRAGAAAGRELGSFRHTITHHRIVARVFEASGVPDGADVRWIREQDRPDYAVSAMAAKALNLQKPQRLLHTESGQNAHP